MIYIFYGTDRASVRQASEQVIASLGERVSASVVHRFEATDCESGQLISLAQSVSLFGGAEVYVIDTPSTSSELLDELAENAVSLAESVHHFIIIDNAITAPYRKAFAKVAVTVEEFKVGKVERFNMFALAEALARKDKRSLWMLLQEAHREGSKTEEIIGMLWWQIKILRLAGRTKTAAEAGVSDFPFNKAKRSLPLFAPGEVDRLARSLLLLYHDGHAGKRDIDLALEEWVLRM